MLRKFLNVLYITQRGCVTLSNELKTITNATTTKGKVYHGMNKHLEESKKHELLMASETKNYVEGIKYLAHMMGKDPENFSDADIASAISYLFPSGLYSRTARPIMLPPSRIIPKRKNLQCSLDGRPFEMMYYTRYPLYYNIMHEGAELLYKLNRIEDENIRKGHLIPVEDESWKNDKDRTFWADCNHLKKVTLEPISEHHYQHFLALAERLITHPYSHLAKDFLMQFRRSKPTEIKPTDLPKLLHDEVTGAAYAESYGQRKRAFAEARVYQTGTGEINVNGGRLLDAFPNISDREQIITPLTFSGYLGTVDVELQVSGGGASGRSGAARLAIARALTCFMDKDAIQKMRFAGLLTIDMRFREKKKSGMPKARATYIWKRR